MAEGMHGRHRTGGYRNRLTLRVRRVEPAELGHTGSGQRSDGEQRAVRLGGGGERLLDLLGREDGPACGQRNRVPLRGQHRRGRIHASEAEPAGGELVDPAYCAKNPIVGSLLPCCLMSRTSAARSSAVMLSSLRFP